MLLAYHTIPSKCLQAQTIILESKPRLMLKLNFFTRTASEGNACLQGKSQFWRGKQQSSCTDDCADAKKSVSKVKRFARKYRGEITSPL